MTKPNVGDSNWGSTLNAHLDTLQAAAALDGDVAGRVNDPVSATTTALNQRAQRIGATPAAGTFHTSEQMLFTLVLIGVDTHDRGYFVNTQGAIFQSDNGMPTRGVVGADRSANKTLPAGTNGYGPTQLVEFKNQLYMLTTAGSAPAVGQLWRTDRSDGDTAFSWTKVLDQAAGAVSSGWACALAADDTAILIGSYGDPAAGPTIQRSTDGTTWTTVWSSTVANNRHVHAVAFDPYNVGHVWATVGDGGVNYIMRSTDHGATWADVSPTGPAYPAYHWQGVQISFTATHVWFASDNRFSTCFVYDRTAATLRDATPNTHRHIAVPAPVPRNGGMQVTDAVFNGTKTMTSAAAAFTSQDVLREVHHSSLPAGRSWITKVNNATSVDLYDTPMTTSGTAYSGTAQTVVFSGEAFHANAIWGTVDPATGYYYCVSALGPGQRVGLFYTTGPGQPLYLLDVLGQINYDPTGQTDFGILARQLYVWKGYVWFGNFRTKLRT